MKLVMTQQSNKANAISMLGLLIFSFSLLSQSFSLSANAPSTAPLTLDMAAEQYVKLGLELGEYDLDYVDSYIGPAQWQQDAKTQPRTKQKLAKHIERLLAQLSTFEANSEQQSRRHLALFKNLRAMQVRANMLLGKEYSFEQEALLVYDTQLPPYDFSVFDQLLTKIDALLPGDGELAERLMSFKAQFVIPADKLPLVLERAIQACKQRTENFIRLPEDERFIVDYANKKDWTSYNWYQGQSVSIMQINTDLDTHIDLAIDIGCHEAYPGHHVWNSLIEHKLYREKGWIEYAFFPLYSPFGLIAEGSANFAVALAFPQSTKIEFEQNILFPMAELDPKLVWQLDTLNQLLESLAHSVSATAQLYLNGKITKEQAIQNIRKYSLTTKPKAEKSVRFIEQYRAYVLNYNLGKQIVADYITKNSQSDAEKWQIFEDMITNMVTASDTLEQGVNQDTY